LTVSVKLYGEFKDLAPETDATTNSIGMAEVDGVDGGSVETLLSRFNIQPSEVSHVFVNSSYSSVNKKVSSGDRVALFPRDMGLLYHWYFTEEE